MAKFVQIIEMKTSKYDEIDALEQEWKKATEGKRTLRRDTVCQDRDHPGTYVVIAEFDSYDEAMQNSNLPETTDFTERMAKLVDGEMKFYNLDVIH
jgi:quinol monooxygenase YgiN